MDDDVETTEGDRDRDIWTERQRARKSGRGMRKRRRCAAAYESFHRPEMAIDLRPELMWSSSADESRTAAAS
ncbi:unnamed protein product [Sphagnum jensenii]|uniref:Uncharacterized protein n=1 Tax=Sphagnum jensenii TaxID=128206 RepID=A0ABP1AS03_9BRYO